MGIGLLARNFSAATSDGTGSGLWQVRLLPSGQVLAQMAPVATAAVLHDHRTSAAASPGASSVRQSTSPAMKAICSIFCLVSALLIWPAPAADPAKAATAPGIQERLTRIDLAVTLAQYKKVRQLIEETSLQYTLEGDPASEAASKEREALSARVKKLYDLAESLRRNAAEYDEKIQGYRKAALASQTN